MRGRRRLEYCRHLQGRQQSLSIIPAWLRPRLCTSLCEGQGVCGHSAEQVGVPLRASTLTPHPQGQSKPVLPPFSLGGVAQIALTCEVISVSLYSPLPPWTTPHYARQSVGMESTGLSLVLHLLTSQCTLIAAAPTHSTQTHNLCPRALALPSRPSSVCQRSGSCFPSELWRSAAFPHWSLFCSLECSQSPEAAGTQQ